MPSVSELLGLSPSTTQKPITPRTSSREVEAGRSYIIQGQPGPQSRTWSTHWLVVLQRSDDDDRSSDRKDGALEEQIERLQEKVESAQSEQKNLFLVIFQVGWLRLKCKGHPFSQFAKLPFSTTKY